MSDHNPARERMLQRQHDERIQSEVRGRISRGNCYVTSEAIYHLLGGQGSGWTPMTLRHEGDVHWFLKHRDTGLVLDVTASQFERAPDYSQARGRGFLTKQPSKRALAMMQMLLWQVRNLGDES